MRAQVAYLLSETPLILTGSFACFQEVAATRLPMTFVYHNPGLISIRSIPRYIRFMRHFTKDQKVKFITNEQSECLWLRMMGLDATHITQNLHARENFFVPNANVVKKYDAVYTAALAEFKRIELAQKIQKISFITYQRGKQSWNLHEYEPRLSHADYNSTFISKEDVRSRYWQSSVGLALSAREGAMWASVEYLLCGLPVVTTSNKGGRDRYFSKNHVTWCPANAEDIAKAVRFYVDSPPCPDEIRTITLEKIRNDRIHYLDYLNTRCGMPVADPESEIERIWGGEEGIEKHAIPVSDLKRILNRIT